MTDLRDRLAEKGIHVGSGVYKLPSLQPGNYDMACPQCDPTRKHKGRASLSVTIDGHGGAVWKCHNDGCGWIGNVPGEAGSRRWEPAAEPAPKPAKQPPKEPRGRQQLLKYFEQRKIGEEVVDFLGLYIGPAWFPQLRREEMAIVAPYVERGQVVNNKYRAACKEFAQDKQAKKTLYNIDSLWDAQEVIFVEGEIDVASVLEALGLQTAVTCIPDGTPEKFRETLDNNDKRYRSLAPAAEVLAKAKKIILAVDGDQAGRNHAHQLALRLGFSKCFLVQWPAGCKDPNDVLRKHGPETLRHCIEGAEGYPVKGLKQIRLGELQDYRQSPRRELFVTGSQVMDRYLKWRTRQLCVVVGYAGDGKSEVITWLSVLLAQRNNWRWAVCSMEHDYQQLAAAIAEKKAGRPFVSHGLDIRGMDDQELSDCEAWIREHYHFIVQDDYEEDLTLDFILDMAKLAHIRHGINGVIVDPWNEVRHEFQEGEREDQYISRVMRKIRLFAEQHDLLIFVVAHPRAIRAKAGEKVAPSCRDASGGPNFANKATICLVIFRPNTEQSMVQVIIEKCKMKDQGGPATVELDWDKHTGLYRERA